MNEWQRKDLMGHTQKAVVRMCEKYESGAEEHDGDLREMPTIQKLKEAYDEAIDLLVYIGSAIDELEKK
jgi:cell fate (sporulation/competence/biofilm development) regulator YmcA (YheA/YmcA/DUF963 family)